MKPTDLAVALIHEVFFGDGSADRLAEALTEARQRGARLAVLPELPLDPWVPHSPQADDADAEPPEGPRHRMLSEAARSAAIAVLGGAITVDPTTGLRHNRALLYDADGDLIESYDKLHLPDEDGFRETAHYVVGSRVPARIDVLGMPVGLQLCSDMYRPQISQALGAQGVQAILAPRATEAATWDRWRAMLVSNAVTSCTFVVSVNRPRPELGVPLGSPSAVICPDGRVMIETTQPLTVVTLEASEIAEARRAYPGYLPVRADVYSRAWSVVRSPHGD